MVFFLRLPRCFYCSAKVENYCNYFHETLRACAETKTEVMEGRRLVSERSRVQAHGLDWLREGTREREETKTCKYLGLGDCAVPVIGIGSTLALVVLGFWGTFYYGHLRGPM